MYSARYQDVIALRLNAGADVHSSLIEVCQQHDVSAAFVVSGIGMLADPELGYFVAEGQYAKKRFAGRFELLNMSGNISPHAENLMGHIHVMLSDEDYSVFGGHLFSAKVGMTLEAQLTVVGEPVKMYRRIEPESGLAGLLVE